MRSDLEAAWARYVSLPAEEGSRRREFAWSIPDGHALVEYLCAARPAAIVEFGCGFSTWIVATVAAHLGATHYLVEPSAIWRERTLAFLAAESLPAPTPIVVPTRPFSSRTVFVVDSGPDEWARVELLQELRREHPEVPCVIDDWQMFASRTLPQLAEVTPWPGRACVATWKSASGD